MRAKGRTAESNGVASVGGGVSTHDEELPADRCREIHRIMVRTRVMEERMIKMSKSGEGYFWIGGPGEEAFNACLGLQVKKGQGPAFDYLHLALSQQRHAGRHGHAVDRRHPPDGHDRHRPALDGPQLRRPFRAKRDWNVVPVTSVIEVQYVMAPGTALRAEAARRRRHHHRHRRRRGHGRGRFRLLPGLEHPAGQRTAGADHRHQQRLGHLDVGVQPARREAHHRPRQGLRHPRRSGGRQRPHRQLARHPAGDGSLPPRAPALHARGDGVAPVRAFVFQRRPARARTSRTASSCSSTN